MGIDRKIDLFGGTELIALDILAKTEQKRRILPFKSTFGCFKDVVYYLVFGFFGAIWLF